MAEIFYITIGKKNKGHILYIKNKEANIHRLLAKGPINFITKITNSASGKKGIIDPTDFDKKYEAYFKSIFKNKQSQNIKIQPKKSMLDFLKIERPCWYLSKYSYPNYEEYNCKWICTYGSEIA